MESGFLIPAHLTPDQVPFQRCSQLLRGRMRLRAEGLVQRGTSRCRPCAVSFTLRCPAQAGCPGAGLSLPQLSGLVSLRGWPALPRVGIRVSLGLRPTVSVLFSILLPRAAEH